MTHRRQSVCCSGPLSAMSVPYEQSSVMATQGERSRATSCACLLIWRACGQTRRSLDF